MQGAIAIGLGFLFMIGTIAFGAGGMEINPNKPWVFAATFAIFYSVVNTVLSLNAENAEKYWTQSIIGFVGTVGALGGIAWLTSGLSINEAGSFRWIFFVVVISYLVFMSIVRLMKGIVEFAQKEEWNAPKKRKRRK